MKSSEKIGTVSAEFNVRYETVHGLTYKKKFKQLPVKTLNTISLQYTLCKTDVQITLQLHNPLNC